MESGLTIIFLKSFANLPLWDQAARLMKWWPEIAKNAVRAKRGTGFLVSVNGQIEEMKSM